MRYQYLYSSITLVEYKDAVYWYDVRSKKAAVNLVLSIKEKLKTNCEDPLRYRNSYKHFRETPLKNILILLFILLMKGK